MVSYGGIWVHTVQKKNQKQNQKQKKNFTVGRGVGKPIAGPSKNLPPDILRTGSGTGPQAPEALTGWALLFILKLLFRRTKAINSQKRRFGAGGGSGGELPPLSACREVEA